MYVYTVFECYPMCLSTLSFGTPGINKTSNKLHEGQLSVAKLYHKKYCEIQGQQSYSILIVINERH